MKNISIWARLLVSILVIAQLMCFMPAAIAEASDSLIMEDDVLIENSESEAVELDFISLDDIIDEIPDDDLHAGEESVLDPEEDPIDEGDSPGAVYYEIIFDTNGHGEVLQNIGAEAGKLLDYPGEPSAEGFLFTGWYFEPECETLWNFDEDIVSGDTILYAGWVEIQDETIRLRQVNEECNIDGHGIIDKNAFDSPEYMEKRSEIKGGVTDNDGPVFNILIIAENGQTVTVGDTVHISADVQDDSGVASVDAFFGFSDHYATLIFSYNQQTEKWETQYTFKENDVDGQYSISEIQAKDQYGNTTTIFSPTGYVDFQGGSNDTTKPVISNITIAENGQTLTVGDTVHISANVQDDSGVASVNAFFGFSGHSTTLIFRYNQQTEKWEAQFTFKQNDVDGQYSISMIWADDQYGNTITVYSPAGYVNFQGGSNDTTKPVISNITIAENGQTLTVGDTVHISANVQDDSGVASVNAFFGFSGHSTTLIFRYNQQTEKWEAQYTFKQNDVDGQYSISMIWADDIYGNSLTLFGTDDYVTLSSNPTSTQTPSPTLSPTATPTVEPTSAAGSTITGDVVVDGNQTINDKSISGNIYVPRGCTLQLNGTVSITGDMFIWGTFYNRATLTVTGTLNCLHYGSMMSAGSYDYGYFYNYGSANITRLNVTDSWLSTIIPDTNPSPSPTTTPNSEPTVTPTATIGPMSGTCGDNLTWTLDEDGLLTISGTGEMESFLTDPNHEGDNIPNQPWPISITRVIIENGVTSIGEDAFYDCSSLTNVTIASSVSHIDDWAFYNCSSLTNIVIPEGVNVIRDFVFVRCRNLSSIVLPSSITSIGDAVFPECDSLTSIIIPEGVTCIGNSMFAPCNSLTSITIPKSVTRIMDSAFSECNTLTDVYYNGTKSEKSNITIAYGNEVLSEATWHCSDGIFEVVYIELNATEINLGKGERAQLVATVLPENAANQTVIWSSNDESVATVIDGVVTAIDIGTTTITASIEDKTATATVNVGPAPQSVRLNTGSMILNRGETGKLKAVFSPIDAYSSTVWSSSNMSVVTVDDEGNVTANAVGTATITVTTFNGKKAMCSVNVANIVSITGIDLDEEELTMAIGENVPIPVVTIMPEDATYKIVSWRTSNTEVAYVDNVDEDDGTEKVIVACGGGTAILTATTTNGLEASCIVTVIIPEENVSLDITEKSIPAGQQFSLTATVGPDNATNKTVTWTTSNPEIVTVDNDGNVTAIQPGTATIVAATANGKTDTCMVTVEAPEPNAITLASSSITLRIGEQYQLEPKLAPRYAVTTYTFRSSNTNMATVSEDGLITAVKKGQATISVVTANGLQAKVIVTIRALDATAVTLNYDTLSLELGSSMTLVATIEPENASQAVDWTSSNEAVAIVDQESGTVTAEGAGTATITATTSNGKTATCVVIVTVPETGVTLNKTALTMNLGGTATLTATVTPNNATNKAVTWSSSNTSIATVDTNGNVSAKAAGTAIVTVKTSNGKTATCTIKVNPYRASGTFGSPGKPWEWYLTVDGTLVISGKGAMASDYVPWGGYSKDIYMVKFEEGVTSIGYDSADQNYSNRWKNVKSVIFPSSIREINDCAFYSCGQLSELVFLDNNQCYPVLVKRRAFENCPIKSICPPKGIKDSWSSFDGCDKIEKISLAHSFPISTSDFRDSQTRIKDVYYDGTEDDRAYAIKDIGGIVDQWVLKANWHYVKIVENGVTLDKTVATLDIKGTVSLRVMKALIDVTDKTVTWTTSDKNIVTVDATGKVTAVLPGTATITAKTSNGKTATCKVTVKAPQPTKMTLPAATTLGVGETLKITPTLTPSYAATTYTYKSSKTKYVVVSADGTIKAKKKGKAIVTVTTANGKTATITVTVKKAPKKVTLSPKTLVLNEGLGATLKAKLPSGTASAITYTSSNSKVATVDANGNVKAVKAGTATITAKTFNNKTATCKVTVITGTPPKDMTLNTTSVTLGKGQTVKIVPKLNSGANTIYTYSTSKKKVATVSADGTITGKKKGKAVITVKTHNGIAKKITVVVYNAPKKVTLSAKTLILNVGASGKLTTKLPKGTYSPITLTSSSTGIATVDASGSVKAVKAGTATITAKTFNNKAANCVVTVLTGTAPTSVTVPEATITLAKGSTYKIVPKLNSGANTVFTYTAKNKTKNKKKIATVSADGTITAKVKGTAIITVKTHNGKTATVTVIVK